MAKCAGWWGHRIISLGRPRWFLLFLLFLLRVKLAVGKQLVLFLVLDVYFASSVCYNMHNVALTANFWWICLLGIVVYLLQIIWWIQAGFTCFSLCEIINMVVWWLFLELRRLHQGDICRYWRLTWPSLPIWGLCSSQWAPYPQSFSLKHSN